MKTNAILTASTIMITCSFLLANVMANSLETIINTNLPTIIVKGKGQPLILNPGL